LDKRQTILESLARGAISLFSSVASAARRALQQDQTVAVPPLAAGNTFNNPEILGGQVRAREEGNRSFEILAREPAIARVVVQDDSGKTRTLYICRAASGDPSHGLISYLAPLGRLASLPAGSEESIPTAQGPLNYYVLEHAELHPAVFGDEWDSLNSVVHFEKSKPVTVRSLRALLGAERVGEEVISQLDRLLAEERDSKNIIEGTKRNIIRNMGLRDQPILDRYQDEIFRLPVNSKLMIMGPPGSGKTTTLIRRLRQKLNYAGLDDDGRQVPQRQADSRPADSWIMFTPTELLKQYLKEAFARENVPASDQRVRTWSDYRRELARNRLGILRDSTGSGSFVLREPLDDLARETISRQTEWFADFQSWQRSFFWDDLRTTAHSLSDNPDRAAAGVGARLARIVAGSAGAGHASSMLALLAMTGDIQALVAKEKDNTDRRIRMALNLQVNRNRDLLDELSRYVETLSDFLEETDELDAEEDEEQHQPAAGREAAMAAYMMAVRSQSRAEASKRNLGRNSRAAKIVEWLGERTPSREERLEIGASLQLQAEGRRFLGPVRRYVHGVAGRYRRFRRLRQSESIWYKPNSFSAAEIGPLELDMILLAELQCARELISENRIAQALDDAAFAVLKLLQDEYKAQVLADEATDFSPIELACMYALTTPGSESFFACGDFNQRITEWGTRSDAELTWACPRIETRSMLVSYRHSSQLFQLAKDIVRLCDGTETSAELPPDRDNNGVRPVLSKNLTDVGGIGAWIAARIKEIEQFTRPLPTVAVLVNSEDEVTPIARALNDALASQNIQAVACTNGRFVGQQNDVRVFDIQHIKGLEFEAVFFVGVDHLAEKSPDLFDKYLYVGATRAATYLGWTCVGNHLPEKLIELEPCFSDHWRVASNLVVA
jgi:hypothetical protein